ncbi:MAG TPA: competence/damage-inducible protein A [Vicinamibacterales bacterium]|nr:competence/damage-inducible protein A [Vicinamibacterales bacterium]
MSAATVPRAAIVAVGSELLTPWRLDTNSLYVTARLDELGIALVWKMVVGDDRRAVAEALEVSLDRAPLVVTIGGLGPTDDDLTREAVADVLRLPLVEDACVLEAIRRRFEMRGVRMPDVNRRQALVPRGAVVLPNAHGTAPGLWIPREGGGVLLLPGPPAELQPMLDEWCREHGDRHAGPLRAVRRVLRITGRTESQVEEATQPIYAGWRDRTPPIETTILASPGQIELHLTARGVAEEEARRALDEAARALARVLGDDLFSDDGRALEEVVGGLLRERRLTIAVVESCTGGLLLSRLTDVPGSSDYVQAGLVCYSNAAKTALAGVPEDLIRAHGAVSEAVALAMAEGARARGPADVGVGVTGIAGPGGGTPGKPVGTVAIAVVGPRGGVRRQTYRFAGGRAQVKLQATQAALDQVRRLLLAS